jgi:hypothetical protein
MKYFLLSVFLITLSCQKKTTTTQENKDLPVTQTDTVENVSEKDIQIDTIPVIISSERKQKSTFVVAKLLSKEPDAKGTETAEFELEFYKKKNKTATTNITVNNYAKGSKWRAIEGLADEKAMGNSPFLKLRLLHKDPKFLKHDYLYFIKNNEAQLIIQWAGINDLGWGEWLDIHNPNQKIEPDYFYCKTGSFKEIDTTDNEIGMLSYSDSIEFRLKNNKWIKELKSKKNTPYYNKEMNFNEVYK